MTPLFLDTKGIAELCSMPVYSVRKMVKRRDYPLPSVVEGKRRWETKEVLEYMRKQKQRPPGRPRAAS